MRWILTILWAAVLFIFTCSVNFHDLIKQQAIDFMINKHPNWSEFLNMDLQWSSNEWVLRKIGHFIGFFILAILASNLGKYKSAFWWSVLYALITEVLQLFFYRSGRLFDVFNDAMGILLAYLCCKFIMYKKSDPSKMKGYMKKNH